MNAPATITGTRMSPWEAQYRLALGSPNERWLLMRLSAEMEAAGEPMWPEVYDLADGTFDEDRSEVYAEIEAAFARWRAEEDAPREGLWGNGDDRFWRDSIAADRAGMGEGL